MYESMDILEWITKHGWSFLMFAIIGEIAIPFIIAPFYKGYSHMTMSLSSLGNVISPVRMVYNLWMLIAGVLFLLSIPALFLMFRESSFMLSLVCVVIIAIFAIGACIFTCFFSVNENKDIITTASKIHGAGSAVGFVLLLFMPLFVSILSYKSTDNLVGTVSIISFVLAFVFFILFIMSDKPQFQNSLIANEGLWQRLNLLFMYLPLGFLAFIKINVH